MKPAIKAVLLQLLKDNMATWNAVPASIKLTGISFISIIFLLPGLLDYERKRVRENKKARVSGICLEKICFPKSGTSTMN